MKPIENAKKVIVNSPNVKYGDEYIESLYRYTMSTAKFENNILLVTPADVMLRIKTARRVPRLGVMLVGWGGNNGSTLTAGLLANKHRMTWETKEGTRIANWFGSITQSSTFKVGVDAAGKDVYVPMSSLLPLVHPDDIVLDGWDISADDLASAMKKARVLDYNLQQKLAPLMKHMKPRPSIFLPDYVAPNQEERANNVIEFKSKKEAVEKIRADVRDFKAKSRVDTVIVLWTANTERMCEVHVGKNDTADNLLKAIEESYSEISPSTLFAVASILEGCTYINGSPQNTFVPGCVELAERYNTFIGGDDFKSGQTKLKSVLVDFLVSAGIKPVSIVSYNHLGNNDGRNLDAPKTFRSKEISKSSVIDDMVDSNSILYKDHKKPDHCVVIKYVPHVGDSKRALDEYISELCLGGSNTISIHNTCEDSLLASPIILDLVILGELCSRIQFYENERDEPMNFHVILSLLSYLLKAPLVPEGAPVVNSLFKQRACIENIMKACIGLPPDHNMSLEHKLPKQVFAGATLQAERANVLKTKQQTSNEVGIKSKGASIPVA